MRDALDGSSREEGASVCSGSRSLGGSVDFDAPRDRSDARIDGETKVDIGVTTS
jgi:hypothetical protein